MKVIVVVMPAITKYTHHVNSLHIVSNGRKSASLRGQTLESVTVSVALTFTTLTPVQPHKTCFECIFDSIASEGMREPAEQSGQLRTLSQAMSIAWFAVTESETRPIRRQKYY